MSKERPILFNDAMVRAVLQGRKTQTRRIMEVPEGWTLEPGKGPVLGKITSPHPKRGRFGAFIRKEIHPGSEKFHRDIVTCKYGEPGDRLWVRERTEEDLIGSESLAMYSADSRQLVSAEGGYPEWWYSRKTCPSIHMPRWASRITLEITDVRVERLQDISEEAAQAEGARPSFLIPNSRQVSRSPQYRWGFHQLWESINGEGSWDTNPWVWVIEFKRVDQEAKAA